MLSNFHTSTLICTAKICCHHTQAHFSDPQIQKVSIIKSYPHLHHSTQSYCSYIAPSTHPLIEGPTDRSSHTPQQATAIQLINISTSEKKYLLYKNSAPQHKELELAKSFYFKELLYSKDLLNATNLRPVTCFKKNHDFFQLILFYRC